MTTLSEVRLEVTKRIKPATLSDLVGVLRAEGLATSVQEQVWVISLDAVNTIRTITPVAIGTYHETFVALPTILSPVLLAGCDRFMVAHNHPSGRELPTQADKELTARIETAAEVCDLWFDDHIIVTPTGPWSSMASLGLIKRRKVT